MSLYWPYYSSSYYSPYYRSAYLDYPYSRYYSPYYSSYYPYYGYSRYYSPYYRSAYVAPAVTTTTTVVDDPVVYTPTRTVTTTTRSAYSPLYDRTYTSVYDSPYYSRYYRSAYYDYPYYDRYYPSYTSYRTYYIWAPKGTLGAKFRVIWETGVSFFAVHPYQLDPRFSVVANGGFMILAETVDAGFEWFTKWDYFVLHKKHFISSKFFNIIHSKFTNFIYFKFLKLVLKFCWHKISGTKARNIITHMLISLLFLLKKE